MIEFLLAPQNFVFTTALVVMVMIAVLEGVGAMMGAGLSAVLDQLIPNVEIDLDMEGPDLDSPGPFGRFLSWISVRRVPVLVLFILFLLFFGLIGLFVQDFTQSLFGFLLPGILASLITLMLTVPLVKGTTLLLAKILPRDETSAISRGSLIGRTAQITLGEAKQGYPSQAKVKDRFGKIHYLMVEPDESGIIFNNGDVVLLVKYDGVCFYAIRPQSEELIKNI
jgi:Inner membrane protein YqiJ, N-terminal/Inner membrane protein YqiJ, OB-fold